MNQLPADYSEQVALARERMEGFKASLAHDALAREDALQDPAPTASQRAGLELDQIGHRENASRVQLGADAAADDIDRDELDSAAVGGAANAGC